MATAMKDTDPHGVTNNTKKEDSLSTNSPMKAQGKSQLESLPKDELIKFVRKQNAVLKQSKAKCDELTSQLEKERSEINRLENEKKDWLSRGVHAEFEKKDKEFEEDFSAVVMERNGLQESLRILQQEYQSVVKESKKYKDALELDALKDDKTQDQLRKDNQDLLEKIEVLQLEKEQAQNALLKLEQENNQLSNTCKELEVTIESMKNHHEPTVLNSNSVEEIGELQAQLSKVVQEKEELMKAVDTFADSQRETKEQEIDNLKDQVEKLLMERNQLQTQLDQFRKNNEVGLNSGDQTDAIKEQTLQENENIDEIQHQEVEVNYEMATKECEENKFYVKVHEEHIPLNP